MIDVHQLVHDHRDLIIQLRRDLHRIPEVAYTEKKTAAYVTAFLSDQDLDIQTGIAQYGIVGLMKTGKPGPTLIIRADMDALPLTEATDLPFASVHNGVMHACGHDAHMAMVLGTVVIINKMKRYFKGNIKFLFQPAEEGPGGAKPMIEAGVMENPKVDFSIGCHVWPQIPEGSIGIRSGPFMAAMDRFDIKIVGREGHGAMPHLCVDALEIGTQVVSGLQRIVSRQMNPTTPSVVTVGRFHAGTTFNIIPGQAELCGTTRTFDPDIWNSWEDRIRKVVSGVCHAMGADFELKFTPGYPVTINDDAIAEIVRKCAVKIVGNPQVLVPEQTMGGEDFSFFLKKSKGCFFVLGTGRKNSVPIHHPKFNFNEDILLIGVETYCRVASKLLVNSDQVDHF